MSAVLLEGSYEDNVYGAVSFREADSNNGSFDYTLHVRQGEAPSHRVCRRRDYCLLFRKARGCLADSSCVVQEGAEGILVACLTLAGFSVRLPPRDGASTLAFFAPISWNLAHSQERPSVYATVMSTVMRATRSMGSPPQLLAFSSKTGQLQRATQCPALHESDQHGHPPPDHGQRRAQHRRDRAPASM